MGILPKISKYAQIFYFCLYFENMKSFGVAGKKQFWCISPFKGRIITRRIIILRVIQGLRVGNLFWATLYVLYLLLYYVL